jgi:trans-aconitate methyltransferase
MYDPVINEYFGGSDFYNFGLWRNETENARDASRVLIKELVGLSPPNPARVLEVGCGKGATTRELRAHWPRAEITGIDVSETQLQTCRHNCPDASFALMDACAMTFPNSSFDLVISVEAAFHFPSRWIFLAHARRVLAPGGCLVMQDVLHRKSERTWRTAGEVNENVLDPAEVLPPENYLSGPEDYQALMHAVGLERCWITDVTEEGPHRFYRHFLSHLSDREAWNGYDPEHVRLLRVGARLFARQVTYCLLIRAAAPG